MVCTLIDHRNDVLKNVQNSSGTKCSMFDVILWSIRSFYGRLLSICFFNTDRFNVHFRWSFSENRVCEKEKNKLRHHLAISMVCSVIEQSSRAIISARGIPQLWQNLDWVTSYTFKNFKIPTLKMCIRTMTIFLLLFISATKLTLLESQAACSERNLIFVKMFEVWSQCLNNNWKDYVSLVPRVSSFSNMAAAGGKTLAHSRVAWLSGSHKEPIP